MYSLKLGHFSFYAVPSSNANTASESGATWFTVLGLGTEVANPQSSSSLFFTVLPLDNNDCEILAAKGRIEDDST